MDWILILASLLLPVVPLFFFPGCVCCGVATCTHCSDVISEATVTISGVTNNACSTCSGMNGTFIFPITGLVPCIEIYHFDPDPCAKQHYINFAVEGAQYLIGIGEEVAAVEQLVFTAAHTSGTTCVGTRNLAYNAGLSTSVWCTANSASVSLTIA